MVRPSLIDINHVDLKHYPFIISLNKFTVSCNVLSPKICVPKENIYIYIYIKIYIYIYIYTYMLTHSAGVGGNIMPPLKNHANSWFLKFWLLIFI